MGNNKYGLFTEKTTLTKQINRLTVMGIKLFILQNHFTSTFTVTSSRTGLNFGHFDTVDTVDIFDRSILIVFGTRHKLFKLCHDFQSRCEICGYLRKRTNYTNQ